MWAVAWNVQHSTVWNEVVCGLWHGMWHGMCNVAQCGMLRDVE